MSTFRPAAPDIDVIVVGAVSPGCTHCTSSATGWVCRPGSSMPRVMWGVPGTGIAIRVRVDIESVHYSYSFSDDLQQEWTWSEKFAAQPEILRYLEHVADRFDLRKDITFDTRIESVVWDDDVRVWTVTTDTGETVTSRYFISGAGNLSVPKTPEFPGIDTFVGEVHMTGNWPHGGVDFTDKRVGVIGTGSSGIQAITEIAKEAGHLTVFQRTPNYATPIGNAPANETETAHAKANYKELRDAARNHFLGVPYDQVQDSALAVSAEDRRKVFDERWDAGGFRLFIDSFRDILFDKDANDTVSEYIRERIHERVNDPEVAQLLAPSTYPYATKRPPLETDYYETYNRDNVTLVDVKNTPIDEITAAGVRTGGVEHELDVLVLATGFDAMTGPLLAMGIVGRDGHRLEDKFEYGPRTYLGLMMHDFPNLFLITGPQSPSVLYNMPLAIEDHVDFVADAIANLHADDLDTIEPLADAENEWVEHCAELASATLMPDTDSWYMGANIPGKPRVCLVYLGGAPTYRAKCAEVVERRYEGFVLTGADSNRASLAS